MTKHLHKVGEGSRVPSKTVVIQDPSPAIDRLLDLIGAQDQDRIGLAEVLAAAEAAGPVHSLDAVARNLRERFGAHYASFLFVDVVGRRLQRVHEEEATPQEQGADQVPLAGSVYDEALRTQKAVVAPQDGRGQRVLAPVTNRGDAIGVLELYLTHITQDVLEQVESAAHALAYLVVTDRRFADLFHWGNRTASVSLPAEIQRQLLPSAPSCQAPEFALAGALVRPPTSPPSTPARPCAPWSPRSPKRATAMWRMTPPSCAWTGTAPAPKDAPRTPVRDLAVPRRVGRGAGAPETIMNRSHLLSDSAGEP